MSGFEVAGVVLGAFLVLVGAAKAWMAGVETLVAWKRFRLKFMAFLGAVDVENSIFKNTLVKVVITATASLAIDFEHIEWKNRDLSLALEDPDVVKALIEHLGESYVGVIRTITTIREAIEGLQELLTLDDGSADWANPNASQLEYRLKSFQLSFSSTGEGLLEIMESENRRLRRLLESTAEVAFIRAKVSSKKSPWTRLFQIVRDQSLNLHNALQRAWTCECESHKSNLQLSPASTRSKTPKFSLVVEIEVERGSVGKRQRAVLQNCLALKSQNCSKAEPSINSNMKSTTVVTTNSLDDDVSKIARDLKAAQLLSIQKPKKLHKKARFGETSPEKESQSPTTEPGETSNLVSLVSGTEDRLIRNLCTELCSGSSPGCCMGYIRDNTEQALYLTIESRRELSRRLQRSVTLEDLLLGKGGVEFRLPNRYRVASALAASLLHLHTTPWANNIEKRAIIFFQKDTDIEIDSPYLSHGFIPQGSSVSRSKTGQQQKTMLTLSNMSSAQVKKGLSSLGILILEIYFGEPIDKCSYRQHYLKEGKVDQWTDVKTAREWVKEVEEPDLEKVVLFCITYEFPHRADWNNMDFRQAVYDNVVKPLEVLAETWTI